LTGEIEFYEPLEPIQPPPTKFEFFKQSSDHKIKLNMTTTEFLQVPQPSRQNHQVSKTHFEENRT
jgi:hypothetical protein